MSANGLEQCSVCSRLLSTRYGGACPRCRASLGVGAAGPARGARAVPEDWPNIKNVLTEPQQVRPKVPAGAKAIWAECLTHALKHVAFFNDEKSWTQLFALPKMVLWAPSSRGGANKKKGGPTREVTKKCRRWLEGERAALWPRAPKQGKARGQSTPLQEELELRAEAYAGEGMLGKATGVFKGERPAAVDASSTADMRAKHPEARGAEAERCARLRRVAAAAAPIVLPEDVIKGIMGVPGGVCGRYVGAQAPTPQRRPRAGPSGRGEQSPHGRGKPPC